MKFFEICGIPGLFVFIVPFLMNTKVNLRSETEKEVEDMRNCSIVLLIEKKPSTQWESNPQPMDHEAFAFATVSPFLF